MLACCIIFEKCLCTHYTRMYYKATQMGRVRLGTATLPAHCHFYLLGVKMCLYRSVLDWFMPRIQRLQSTGGFSTYFCSLWIKCTMGFRGHHLYQLHILKTQSKQYAHIGVTNIQLCGTYACLSPTQITTTVLENNHQGLCKFSSK